MSQWILGACQAVLPNVSSVMRPGHKQFTPQSCITLMNVLFKSASATFISHDFLEMFGVLWNVGHGHDLERAFNTCGIRKRTQSFPNINFPWERDTDWNQPPAHMTNTQLEIHPELSTDCTCCKTYRPCPTVKHDRDVLAFFSTMPHVVITHK